MLEVYKITNLRNNKLYIGITSQGINRRWQKHCSDINCNSNFSIHNAIRKYGKINFQIETIEVIENEDYAYLKEREKYWIKQYNSYDRKKGYNLTLGGDGTFGRFHSEETKDKIRQKVIGRKCSLQTLQKMSYSKKKLIYNANEMSKRAIKGNKVRWSNPEKNINASIKSVNNRCILQYDLNNNFIREYYNISEAARILGICRQNISKNASGKFKLSGGFIWKYKNVA